MPCFEGKQLVFRSRQAGRWKLAFISTLNTKAILVAKCVLTPPPFHPGAEQDMQGDAAESG